MLNGRLVATKHCPHNETKVSSAFSSIPSPSSLQNFHSLAATQQCEQRRKLKEISRGGGEHFTSHSAPIFLNLKILKLHDLFQLKLLSFVYESVNKISPVCFHNFFRSVESVHQYDTRQAGKDDIFLPQKNTSQYGLRSERFNGAKCWNDIPVEIKRSPSVKRFRHKLKTFLLSITIESDY